MKKCVGGIIWALIILVGYGSGSLIGYTQVGDGPTQTAPTALVPAVTTAAKPPAAERVEAKAPTLTTEQKQAIQLAAKDIEIAQLKAQQAANDFTAARDRLQKLIAAHVPAGYQLTEALDLVKTPEPAKKDEPKK